MHTHALVLFVLQSATSTKNYSFWQQGALGVFCMNTSPRACSPTHTLPLPSCLAQTLRIGTQKLMAIYYETHNIHHIHTPTHAVSAFWPSSVSFPFPLMPHHIFQ